jgi:hypothetical protein
MPPQSLSRNLACFILDGYVKSPRPLSVLHFTLPLLGRLGAGSVPVTVSLSNRVRLASGAFYEAAPDLKLY